MYVLQVGDADKLVKTLFAVARANKPAVIFIDEVDSLLSKRSDDDRDHSIRMKNEFLLQMANTNINYLLEFELFKITYFV